MTPERRIMLMRLVSIAARSAGSDREIFLRHLKSYGGHWGVTPEECREVLQMTVAELAGIEAHGQLYVVDVHDRHCDNHIEILRDKGKAIVRAKLLAERNARAPEDVKESPMDGWLWHCDYSVEGDFVRVLEVEVSG